MGIDALMDAGNRGDVARLQQLYSTPSFAAAILARRRGVARAGDGALYYAAMRGHLDAVKYLLTVPMEVENSESVRYGFSQAATGGYTDILDAILVHPIATRHITIEEIVGTHSTYEAGALGRAIDRGRLAAVSRLLMEPGVATAATPRHLITATTCGVEWNLFEMIVHLPPLWSPGIHQYKALVDALNNCISYQGIDTIASPNHCAIIEYLLTLPYVQKVAHRSITHANYGSELCMELVNGKLGITRGRRWIDHWDLSVAGPPRTTVGDVLRKWRYFQVQQVLLSTRQLADASQAEVRAYLPPLAAGFLNLPASLLKWVLQYV